MVGIKGIVHFGKEEHYQSTDSISKVERIKAVDFFFSCDFMIQC